MIESVRRDGIVFETNGLTRGYEITKSKNDYFFQLAKKNNVFVLSDLGIEKTWRHSEIDGVTFKELDLPFSTCSFEMLSDKQAFFKHEHKNDVNKKEFYKCLLINETSPKEYEFFALVGMIHGSDEIDQAVYCPSNKDDIYYKLTNNCADQIISLLGVSQLGSEKINRNIKLGSGNKKEIHRIKNIIHISPKKTAYGSNPLTHQPIDWSHRWQVRGHWRNIGQGKIGKNREGDYNQHGFTWVSDCIKGPEDAPLIKKTRVVHPKAPQA